MLNVFQIIDNVISCMSYGVVQYGKFQTGTSHWNTSQANWLKANPSCNAFGR
ncbi:hypothetical protein [Gelidibacter gilvus]|uniref:hypothetical protein n=1 Tax=Gelidibacter gilvus TaxID=59602 RepID=UPI00167CE50D|nr:hypothetical protein [Gelidibacter gilvus]